MILRVSLNCGSDYEWGHHAGDGPRVGLTDAQIAASPTGPTAPGWTSDHERVVLRAVDRARARQRHRRRDVGAAARRLRRAQLIDKVCMLAGDYVMLAGT